MNTATRHFVYGVSQSIGDTLVTYTLTAARWGVICWDFFTQPQVIQTYRWVGAMTVALAQLVWWSAVWVYAHIARWAEREVQSCIQQPLIEVMDIPPVSELLQEMPQSVVDPSLTVNPVAQDFPALLTHTTAGTPSRDALRKEAKHRKIPGYSRMSKFQLLEALGYYV